MPLKLIPGTPSMLAGRMIPCQWMDVMWPWIEPTGSWLATRRFTVVPCRQRRMGSGREPFTVIAGRTRPVKFIGVSPMDKSNSVPDKKFVLPEADHARCGIPPKPATTPPATRPWTNRRRPKRAEPMESGESNDIWNSSIALETDPTRSGGSVAGDAPTTGGRTAWAPEGAPQTQAMGGRTGRDSEGDWGDAIAARRMDTGAMAGIIRNSAAST